MLEFHIFKEHKKSTCMQKNSRECEGPLKAEPSNVKMGHFMHKHDLTRYLRVVGHAHSADVVVSSGGNFSGTPRSMAEAKKTYSVCFTN